MAFVRRAKESLTQLSGEAGRLAEKAVGEHREALAQALANLQSTANNTASTFVQRIAEVGRASYPLHLLGASFTVQRPNPNP